jgi:hypothetical protein
MSEYSKEREKSRVQCINEKNTDKEIVQTLATQKTTLFSLHECCLDMHSELNPTQW